MGIGDWGLGMREMRGTKNSKFKIRLGKLGGMETDTTHFPQNSKLFPVPSEQMTNDK